MSQTNVTILTILISTGFVLLFAGVIIYYVFKYQKARFDHKKEVLELREQFNQVLLQSKLEVQEQTFDFVAKELHANCGQIVSLISINLAELYYQSTPETKETIAATKLLAKQLLEEIRALSGGMNTDNLKHIGFKAALS